MTEYTDIGGIAIHPAANLFPMLGDQQHAELVADIRKHGVRTCLKFLGQDIETAQLLDGRNRLKAILEIGGIDYRDHSDLIDPDELEDKVGYVLSLNLHRRHMSESQLSIVAGKAANLKHGTNKYQEKVEVSRDTSTSEAQPMAIATAAAAVGISTATAKRGKKVVDSGVPELVTAVEDGRLSANAAAKVAKLPEGEQPAALAEALKPKPPRKKAAKKAAEPKVKASDPEPEPEPQSTKPDKKQPGPICKLKELFDSMTFEESKLVSRFAEWALEQQSMQTVYEGCATWLTWK